jgi:hypothetical protein
MMLDFNCIADAFKPFKYIALAGSLNDKNPLRQ